MTATIETGPGYSLEPVEYKDEGIVGYIERHPRPDNGEPCQGFVWVNAASEAHVDGPVWTVEQAEPLTLAPSILCGACGRHGFIRQGRWVDA